MINNKQLGFFKSLEPSFQNLKAQESTTHPLQMFSEPCLDNFEIHQDLDIKSSKFPIEYAMLKKSGLVQIAEIYNHVHGANIQIVLTPESDGAGTTEVLKNPQIFKMIEETMAACKDAQEEVRKCFVIGSDNAYSHKIAILYIRDPALSDDQDDENEFFIIMDSQSSKREDVSHFASFGIYRYLPEVFQSNGYSCAPFSLEFALATTCKSQGKFEIPNLASFFSRSENVGPRGDIKKLPRELIFLSQKSAVNRSFFDDEGVLLRDFDDPEAQKANGKTFTDHAYLRVKSADYRILLSQSDQSSCEAM